MQGVRETEKKQGKRKTAGLYAVFWTIMITAQKGFCQAAAKIVSPKTDPFDFHIQE